jgi:predicted peptidase
MVKKNTIALSIFSAIFIPVILHGQMNVVVSQFKTQQNVNIVVDYEYLLQFPENYDGNEYLPLLVFLHGSGERGDNIDLVKVHGPWRFLDANPGYRFIVLAPQCDTGDIWDPYKLGLLIEEIVSSHPVDTARIYLTGLSMGGFGTWDLAMLYPDRFAALAPVCGTSNLHRLEAQKVKHIPVWVFHGALDDVVPYQLSTRVVKELEGMAADVRFTGYPMAGHDSWTETYLNPELYDWFLLHKLE